MYSLQVSSGGDSILVFFKQVSTLSGHVTKSANIGDASLYDKHFVTNIKSGLTPVFCCKFPTTALKMSVELDHTLSSHLVDSNSSVPSKKRHHCLCVLRLNSVHADVNVGVSGFHWESSPVAIVYTSVLESHVSCTCHKDGAHQSDVLVLGSDTLSPRYHRGVDIVLKYL